MTKSDLNLLTRMFGFFTEKIQGGVPSGKLDSEIWYWHEWETGMDLYCNELPLNFT